MFSVAHEVVDEFAPERRRDVLPAAIAPGTGGRQIGVGADVYAFEMFQGGSQVPEPLERGGLPLRRPQGNAHTLSVQEDVLLGMPRKHAHATVATAPVLAFGRRVALGRTLVREGRPQLAEVEQLIEGSRLKAPGGSALGGLGGDLQPHSLSEPVFH